MAPSTNRVGLLFLCAFFREVIAILSLTRHCMLDETDTSLCLHKLGQDGGITPDQVKPYVPTALGCDNIDRLEETLTGCGTSHRVNGIAVQPRVFGPELPKPARDVPKSKQRTVSVSLPALPVYAVGTRCGPPTRSYVEVKTDICADALKKNFIWLLCRLHSATNQSVPSWTGYNILASNSVDVIPSVVSYLPTINAPATQMATVHEILLQSEKIMNSLHISNMSVTFDQAL
ncbi:hypothetical protein D5F01_LYC08865 [Larimichthys crocea]|uniref:Uncharacterized protein n=1 Tax=Larimichthys crocea TaxID=215358 RepID=A0A6G0IJ24_LARCR|nr:hypothetical protein D5F01_LYC08865 [Larimichthys crocea]